MTQNQEISPRFAFGAIVAFSLVVFLVAGAPAPKLTPQQAQAKAMDDQGLARAVNGVKMLKATMRDPDSFTLQEANVITGTNAVCYTYHARNGFGGMNRGRAVISRDAKHFKSDTDPGFADLWNNECLSPGYDKTWEVNEYIKLSG
jgi:hypothetical protein